MSISGLYWTIRRRAASWLWARHVHWLLDKKGFRNNSLHQDDEFLDAFKGIYGDGRMCMQVREAHNLYDFVRRSAVIEGEIAEVGVYKGGSARLICAAKGEKRLHLFDTFEGMPDTESDSREGFWKKSFTSTSLESVREYLSGSKKVEYHRGFFPDTTAEVDDACRFSMVNLDVDLYKSTADALEYFYPKMNRGGIILSHDYRFTRAPGVKQAFDEFFEGKDETVIPLWDTQCVVVKL